MKSVGQLLWSQKECLLAETGRKLQKPFLNILFMFTELGKIAFGNVTETEKFNIRKIHLSLGVQRTR